MYVEWAETAGAATLMTDLLDSVSVLPVRGGSSSTRLFNCVGIDHMSLVQAYCNLRQ